MRWLRAILPAGLLLAGAVVAVVPMGNVRAAELPSSLTCTFLEGGAWAYEQGKYAQKPADKLAFVIRDIDHTVMTARMERKDGLVPLKMVQAVDALHFIEVGMEGYLNLTTVYEKQGSGDLPAVHSRHVAVLGEPLISQYRGTCTAK